MKKLKHINIVLLLIIFVIALTGCNLHIHSFTQKVIAPTCETKGYTEFTCACGMIAKNDFVSPLGHSNSDWTIIKEATEEETGLQERTCSTCGKVEQEEIAKQEHSHIFDVNVVEPTCLESGYTEYTCYCGYSYQDNIIYYLGHDFSDWIVTKEPTETTGGKKEKQCTRCGEKIVFDIPRLDHVHNYIKTIVEVTCENDGYTQYLCDCKDEYKEDIITAPGHKYCDWVVTMEPTDLKDGSKERICSVCNNKEIESIPKLNHTHGYIKTIIPPTCTEEGYTLYKCSCDDQYKKDFVNAYGHETKHNVIKKSQYYETGVIEYSCINCDYKDTKDLNYFACYHNFVEIDSYNNSNYTPGIKIYACEFCIDIKSEVIHSLQTSTNTNISLEEYSLLAINQSLKQANNIFEQVIKNNQKELFMYPYMSLNEYKIVKDFTLDLVKDCTTEKEKAKVIYDWVVNNLDYDTNAYSQSVYQTFINKKAVCFGYTSLLHDMLSAVGIMSSYVSGYTEYSNMEYSDLFNLKNLPNSHAWLYAYVGNEILIMDATWADGYQNLNYGFNMDANSMYKTYLVTTIDEINIIPNNIDYKNYTHLIYNIDDYLVYMNNGKIDDNTSYIKITRNKSVDILFVCNYIKYSIYNEKDAIGCLVRNGFYCSDISKQTIMDNWTYSLYNGITYKIQDIMNYIKLLNNDYNYNIELDLPDAIKQYYNK